MIYLSQRWRILPREFPLTTQRFLATFSMLMQAKDSPGSTKNAWQPDAQLPGFEVLEIPMPPDYDGEVVATLVRLPVASAPKGPALYVHGYLDYFFQRHLAERFAAEGYAFYALDLRKHGRSLRPHQHPNFCKSINEYYADLTRALLIIGEPVTLIGHSTGGLVCSLYCHEGERRKQVKALWLNNPFLDFNIQPKQRGQLAIAAGLGRFFPFLKDDRGVPPAYGESIHKNYAGEWDYNLTLKPLRGFPVFYGWIRAIRQAQAKAHEGLSIACPVLAMHSDEADIVLNWRHIARWSPALGKNVVVQSFPGAYHDLILSPKDIREAVLNAVFAWLSGLSGSTSR